MGAEWLRRPKPRNAASGLIGTAPAVPSVLPGRIAHDPEARAHDDARSRQGATRQAVVGRLLADHGIRPNRATARRSQVDIGACRHRPFTLGVSEAVPGLLGASRARPGSLMARGGSR